ncbi:MAG: hypothetical protein ABRQ26_00725 [Syntrophomonadaceae bacterium]
MADFLPFYVVMVVGIPETIVVLLLGFQLFNDHISFKHAFIASILASLNNYFIRYVGVAFGVHTLITISTIILVCYLLTKKNVWKIASATMSGLVVMLAIQVSEFLIIKVLAIETTISNQPWLNILIMLPEVIIMGIIFYVARKRKFALFNSNAFEIKN